MSCSVKFTPKLKEIARVDAAGASGTSTVYARLRGLDPRLLVMFSFYFRKSGANEPTTGTWTLAPVVQDGASNPNERPLANVFTSRPLPDGWELQSVGDYRATLSLSVANSETGSWYAYVSAGPAPGACVSPEKLQELYGALKLDGPPNPTLIKA